MTIKIDVYQQFGVKTDELVDVYEFCCWYDLHLQLSEYKELNKCPTCIWFSKYKKVDRHPKHKQKEKQRNL